MDRQKDYTHLLPNLKLLVCQLTHLMLFLFSAYSEILQNLGNRAIFMERIVIEPGKMAKFAD